MNSKGTNWVSLFIDRNAAVCFDLFGIQYISPEILNKIGDKSITPNMFVQDNESIMCGFYCITFIEYILARRNWFILIGFFQRTRKRMKK